MSGVNKVILIGRLGKDPELRYTPSGSAVGNFSLATSEVYKDKSGERQEKTEWHNIVVWNKQAEHVSQYLAKGSQCYIEGSLRTRSYEDKQGVKKYVTEIVAQRVQFLDPKKREALGPDNVTEPLPGGGGAMDDDIPFAP